MIISYLNEVETANEFENGEKDTREQDAEIKNPTLKYSI
jgi:hypothetical protein